MTSLGSDCFVGKLTYVELSPPVSGGGGENLQQTCVIGNSTDTGILLTDSVSSSEVKIDRNSCGTTTTDTFVLKNNATDRVEITSDPSVKFMNTNVDPYLTADGIGERLFFEGTKSINIASGDVSNIKIGNLAGFNQTTTNIAVGYRAGATSQEKDNIAIGSSSGDTQGGRNVAVGEGSGASQNEDCIAIGTGSGSNQSENTISIGSNSGRSQKPNAIAIGNSAGGGGTNGEDVIYIGNSAGRLGGRANSIYIGEASGAQSTGGNQNAIVVNATGNPTDDAGGSTCVIKPIRGASNPEGGVANSLRYDTTTGEVCYHIP